MRLIHIISALQQGGAETQLETLIKHMNDHEHIVASLSHKETELGRRMSRNGIKVHYFGIDKNLLNIISLRRFLRRNSSDNYAIQCWMYHANLIGWVATLGLQVPLFWNIRRSDTPKLKTEIISKLTAVVSKFCSVVIFCNSRVGIKNHIRKGYDTNKFVYVPNGYIFQEQFVSIVPDGIMSSKHVTNICCVGRFNKDKGQDILLDAFFILKDRFSECLFEHLRFYFIGRDNSKFIKSEYPHLIQEPSDQLIFLDERSDIANCLQHMDIFCLPSRTEGFPNVLVEAMYAELPCIATNVGEVANILPTGNIIINSNSSDELAAALEKLINAGKQTRIKVGKFNHAHAVKHFSINKTSDIMFKHYTRS
ncbi:glycosyltransferase [Amylibacter sp.]|nr:glycosyltransferase [Amylibacter sp.]